MPFILNIHTYEWWYDARVMITRSYSKVLFAVGIWCSMTAFIMAQAPAPGGGGTQSNGADNSPSSSKGAGLAVLFEFSQNSLKPIAAVTYDFVGLNPVFGIKTKLNAPTPGTKASSADKAFAITRFLKINPGLTEALLPQGVLPAQAQGVTLDPDGYFTITRSPITGKVHRFDALGRWVTEMGDLADPGTGRALVQSKNVVFRSVMVTDPKNPSGPQIPATQNVTANEIFFTLISGASGGGSASGGSSNTTSGGIGAGLRFSLHGGNSSFFIGGWIDQLQFKQSHIAIGFTILK
jgi:hypothetical protein